MKYCPKCNLPNRDSDTVCYYCGTPLNAKQTITATSPSPSTPSGPENSKREHDTNIRRQTIRRLASVASKSVLTATLLSFFVIGGGQIYVGRVKRGIIFNLGPKFIFFIVSAILLQDLQFLEWIRFIKIYWGFQFLIWIGNIFDARSLVSSHNARVQRFAEAALHA